ncbi:MAG: Phosphate transport system regulatory protein PhoU [uncultured Acidimicrobiales bacterium]|uniref:Phosphate-specific transport system accessory protein PhoU n=1 Tax=uncultured Acidimicrobiales bacterium TaxID=310071 RepID=A0A6J4ITT0_9ACTN|nr:MAG: Phosphate transport system regulatory protein PhoU [uncultured Acidimicrobiales bacterium]
MSQHELRRTFHDDLAVLRGRVEAMARVVVSGTETVTAALLAGDVEAAAAVIAADAFIDAVYPTVEADVFSLVARQAPVARDLRFLMATLRVAQEIERSGDLIASVGRRVGAIDPRSLTAEVRFLLEEMGRQAAIMFRAAAGCYSVLDAEGAAWVRDADDAMDALHHRLLQQLFTASEGTVASTVELGHISRFYERVADHAVVIAERVCFVAQGEMNAGDADERTY